MNISEDQIGILQQGFYNVVNGTSPFTTAPGLKSDKFSIAAKTGTAETQATDANGVVHTTVNSNLVAYAPYENPEIAISVVLPHLNDESSKPNPNDCQRSFRSVYGNVQKIKICKVELLYKFAQKGSQMTKKMV